MNDAPLPRGSFFEETIDHYPDVDSLLHLIREGRHMCSLLCAGFPENNRFTTSIPDPRPVPSSTEIRPVENLRAKQLLRLLWSKYSTYSCMRLWEQYPNGTETEFGLERAIGRGGRGLTRNRDWDWTPSAPYAVCQLPRVKPSSFSDHCWKSASHAMITVQLHTFLPTRCPSDY